MTEFMTTCMNTMEGDAAFDALQCCFGDFGKLSSEERVSFLNITSKFHPNNK